MNKVAFLILAFSLFIKPLMATEPAPSPAPLSAIACERAISSLGIVELKLKNGMTICLKPVDSAEDEILIQGFGPGGYASIVPAQRAAAQLAAAIAWESGAGSFSNQELNQYLYNNEVELALYVGPNSHSIEGSAPQENIQQLLKVANLLLTQPRFKKEALPKVTHRALQSAQLRVLDTESQFEDTVKEINTNGLSVLKPLTSSEIQALDFQAAQAFYEEHFLDPAKWTFVFVGNFDVEEMKPLIASSLGAVSQTQRPYKQAEKLEAVFPKGVTQKLAGKLQSQEEGLTRITFCLHIQGEPFHLKLWEVMTQVVETQLRKAFVQKTGSTHGVDVALELPLYPSVDPIWLTLEFRCRGDLTQKLVDLSLEEMRKLKQQGPVAEDLATAIQLQECNDLFWEGDDQYLLALLSNHYQLGLNIEDPQLASDCKKPSAEMIAHFLHKTLDLSNYTVVSQTAEKL